MYVKGLFEVFKVLGRLGIKNKDIIGMGGDVVKMGKSLFNTRINPQLLTFIEKNQKIPTNILEEVKLHERTLKNATESQKNLFLENIKSISKLKTPPNLQEAEIIKFTAKSKSPVPRVQKQATGIKQLDSKAKVLEDFKVSYPKEHGRLKGNETVEQIKEIMFRLDTEGIPFQHGGIANHFRYK